MRPDYALIAAPLAVLLVGSAPSSRARLSTIALGALPGLAFQLFRMGYFAALVPNTALAKEAFESNWAQGVLYLWNSIDVYRLRLPLALLVLLFSLTARWLWLNGRAPLALYMLGLLLGGVADVMYVVRHGGDFMHGRLLLPGFFAICASVACVRVTGLPSMRRLQLAAWMLLGGWAALCAAKFRVAQDNRYGIGDERGWHARVSRVAHPTRLEHYQHFPFYRGALAIRNRIATHCQGRAGALVSDSTARCQRVLLLNAEDAPVAGQQRSLALKADAAPEHVVAVVSMPPLGIAGNVLGTRVSLVDWFGLADPLASRVLLEGRGRPGHEKAFSAVWLAAKYAAPHAASDPNVALAAEVLHCPPLRALAHATRDELTLRRFVDNVRLAFPLHSLRIPSNPAAAKKRLCPASR